MYVGPHQGLGIDVLQKSKDWSTEDLAQALDVDIKAILDPKQIEKRGPEGSFRKVIDVIGYHAGRLALKGDADALLKLRVALVDIHHRNLLPRLKDLEPDERAGAHIESFVGRLANLQSAVEMRAKQEMTTRKSDHDPKKLCCCGHTLREHQTEHGNCGYCPCKTMRDVDYKNE